MNRKYYPNDKNHPAKMNSKKSMTKTEDVNIGTQICCADCGASSGTLHKTKRNGSKIYLCNQCFDNYVDDDYS